MIPTASTPLSAKHGDLPCFPWEGRGSEYQFAARDVLQDRLDVGAHRWVAVTPVPVDQIAGLRADMIPAHTAIVIGGPQ